MGDSELMPSETHAEVSVKVENQHFSLIRLAVESGAEIEKLEKLMALQERHEDRLAKMEFVKALSSFQSEIPIIGKKGEVSYQTTGKPAVHYKYAKIEDIADAIRPALKDNGLSYRFSQTQGNGLITVSCIVSHRNGHSESGELSSTPDTSGGKDALKSLASTISYLRRYTLTGQLGIVVGGEDNDGGDFVEPSASKEEGQFYAEGDFNANFPAWSEMIKSGKTAEKVIGYLLTKGVTLSAPQKQKLNEVGK